VKRAGLPEAMRLHDVRHGVATAMLKQGVHPAIASAVLGHASPAFTMSVYQHVVDTMAFQAAADSNRLWAWTAEQRVAGRTRSGVPSPRRIAPRVCKMFAERQFPVSPGSSPAPDRRASCLVSGGGRESNPCRPPETRDHLRPVSPRTSCRSHRPC
jgi:hypothetical protein